MRAPPHAAAAWYGGGPKIARSVIAQGDETFVELAPPIFRVHAQSRPIKPVSLSKTAPLRELKRRAVEALDIAPEEAAGLVMVSLFDGREQRVLDQPDVSVDDARCAPPPASPLPSLPLAASRAKCASLCEVAE